MASIFNIGGSNATLKDIKYDTTDNMIDIETDINLNAKRLTNIQQATQPNDAVSLKQVNNLIAGITGGNSLDDYYTKVETDNKLQEEATSFNTNLNTQITNVNTKINALPIGGIETNKNDIVTNSGLITTNTNNITNLNNDIVNINTSISGTNQDITDINNDITELNTKIDNLPLDDIEKNKDDILTNSGNITSNTNNITYVVGETVKINTSVVNNTQDITTLTTNLNSKVALFNSRTTNNSIQIASVKNDIETVNTSIDNVSDDLNDLSNNVATEIQTIQTQISNLTTNPTYYGAQTFTFDFLPNGGRWLKFMIPNNAPHGKYFVEYTLHTLCLDNTTKRYYIYNDVKTNILATSEIFTDRYNNIRNGCVVSLTQSYIVGNSTTLYIPLGFSYKFFDNSISANIRCNSCYVKATYIPGDYLTIGYKY